MTEKENIFNTKFIYYGGIYLDLHSDEGKTLLREIENLRRKVNDYYKPRKALFITQTGVENKMLKNLNIDANKYHPYVNLYAVDNKEINAFASKIEDDYFIGIYIGVIQKLDGYIKEFVEDEAFEKVPEIGKCDPRTILKTLTNNCIEFLLFHEFFHIMNGHCDLMNEYGCSELFETNSSCEKNGMVRQTLEFDADCCAIASIVNEYFRSSFSIIESMERTYGLTGRPNLNSTVQFITGLLVSTYILNHLLNSKIYIDSNITEEKLEQMTHPLPGIRLQYIWANIGTILLDNNIYDKNETNEIMDRALNVGMAFIKQFNDIAYCGFFAESFKEKYVKHLQKIHDNWKIVRSLLVKSYVELAPYEENNFIDILTEE